MADQMTAREAWEIVKDGDPWDHSHESDAARQAAVARYARACEIVEARIDLDPSALVAELEEQRAEWVLKYPSQREFDGGYLSGLTKAIEIVKEHSK